MGEEDWENGGDRTFLTNRHLEQDCRHHETARRQRDAAYAAIGCRDLMRLIHGEEPLSLMEVEQEALEEQATRLLLGEGKKNSNVK